MTEDTEGQEPKRFFRIRTSIVESMTKAGMAEEEESKNKTNKQPIQRLLIYCNWNHWRGENQKNLVR